MGIDKFKGYQSFLDRTYLVISDNVAILDV